ncbi:PBSX family phage terminase large subunit [Lysinibacillus irui]|uniref:PBSX family phage terminase large subunit n=1 Tax=Lysinibacillus irui TaxID=2998077 RepID=A0ABU5NJF0_9BACI|nr:PBSX family phage terminase large subunit [Lysinibacillus irui]MEA0553771.1 PBSX family phage terminase large subunit [Lysinibacillus irui]MEA0976155.1 PBSX family phage terminase large subunit [Lysinibacillus irui]MEA1042309.1 PBSX family phage terminase large subunit [Lysinibacillus irui]
MTNSEGFKFQPFSKKQMQILAWWTDSSPHKDKNMVIAYGAIRSGKTICMITSFVLWSLHTFQTPQNFIIAGKSHGALKRNVLMPLFEILDSMGIAYDYLIGEGKVVIGEHRYFIFGGANERSFETLQGLTAAGAYLDEVILMPRNFVEQAFGRCSVKGAKYFMNLNPGSPLHWFKKDIIDKAEEKKALVLRFTMDDNHSLSEEAKERLKAMFSGVLKRRYIDGEFVLAEGLVYDAFEEETNVVSEIPEDEKVIRTVIGCDFGTQNSTVFLLVGITNKNNVYVLDEYYHSGREANKQKAPTEYSVDYRNFIKKNAENYPIGRCYIDAAATHFIVQLHKDGVRGVAKAKKDIIPGIAAVQNLIAQGRFFILHNCKHLIQEMQTYSWKEGAIDTVVKENDGCVDALRYAIFTDNIR